MEKEKSNNVRNGLAFEYAIIQEYVSYFKEHGILYKIKNPSLKLEVSPVGNPTTLFTTHIFNDYNK